MLLKPWDERKRSSIKLQPLVQAELSKIEGVNAFAFNLPPLPGGPGGLPVQMVINSTSRIPGGLRADAEAEGRRAQERPVHRLRQRSRLQPAGGAGQDRPLEGERSRHHHGEQVGNTLATLLGGNYVNRFNLEGRSYQVIPQVPRDKRLSPESLGGYYVPTDDRAS